MRSTGLILLAAGASTRLGQPKQQLMFRGQSLLQHALQTAQTSVASSVVIVLGAGAADIQRATNLNSAYVVENPEWPEGMASSIRVGLTNLLNITPETEAAIFMVCDQPFVTPALLNELISTFTQTNKEIIACAYQDTLGTPVLFSKKYFPELFNLQGQEGAKKLIKRYDGNVAAVSFPEGQIDIDTTQDYENL